MRQLTTEQRYKIEAHHSLGYGIREIGRMLEIPASTISRELSRNSVKGRYEARRAEKMSRARRSRGRLKLQGELLAEVEARLEQKDSPEQIAGRLKADGVASISHEAIYLMVYENRKNGGDLYKNLRFSHRKRRKRRGKKDNRGLIPNKTMIDERPAIIENRERLGDFEGDTIIGKGHQGVIVTLAERQSKLVLMGKSTDKSAEAVRKTTVELCRNSPIKPLSITFDNGTEFAQHELIAEQTGAKIYFAHPYSSWERGLNENSNGLIRQFIPKNQPFSDLDEQFILAVQDNLNTRPRKSLGFLSPIEFFIQATTQSAGVAFET